MGSDLSFEDMLSRDLSDYDYNIISESDSMYVLESVLKTLKVNILNISQGYKRRFTY